MKTTGIIGAATLLAVATSASMGATTYRAFAAENTGDSPYSGGHAFWLPGSGVPNGGSSTFLFVEDSGRLTISDDLTTARLTGVISSVNDPTSTWAVDFNFMSGMDHDAYTDGDGHTTPRGTTAVGSAKRELHGNRYTNNGGTIDPTDWQFFYLDEDNATLTGLGDHDGTVLDFYQRPDGASYGDYAFQLGMGANGKNLNFGMSGWFGYTGAHSGHGDINIDLVEVPAPGTAALAGIAGLAAFRRRR